MCEDWDIDCNKITCVVTDHGANMVAAVKAEFGESKHLPCFAHTINLIATKSVPLYKEGYGARVEPVIEEEEEILLEEQEETHFLELDAQAEISAELSMIRIIKKMKTVIKFFKASEVASRLLREYQMQDGTKEGCCLALILDVRTRWNSITLMIERFLLMTRFISQVLLAMPKGPTMLSGGEILILREVCSVLKPLMSVMMEMSGEQYVTCSKVIPIVRMLKLSYTSLNPECMEAVSLKANILFYLDKYFKNVEKMKLLAMSTFLDPRFKKLHFESALAASNAVSWTSDIVKEQIRRVSQEKSAEEQTYPVTSAGTTGTDIWSFHDSLVADNMKKYVPENTGGLPTEVKMYLNTPESPRLQNPFEVWEGIKEQHPEMYKVATKYLSLSATSVPSERLFSRAGQLVTRLRNRLSGPHIDMLLFLQSVDENVWFS
ncbi:E3 SUMO-protein ligase ZBED1-like [Malaya genurostris]|uniref:E3 SUMO-protein ligase ZBED1-like n=1 Tax=Malaya genurostris TaxID=325434 RepID=UPI0026F39449|nr:E3 SUMO-protein ligase ZBED1-like [Malaya genurostris]